MIVAPNSPSARAQHITSPAASAALASGTVIVRKTLALGRAIDAGGVLEVAVDAGDARARGADEERRRDEGLGEDHRERRERDRDPRTSNGAAEQSAPTEDEQQRETGDRRRQHDRQVDDAPRRATCRGTVRRARTMASGRPRATVRTRLTAVVMRLSQSASRTTGDATATASDRRGSPERQGDDRQPEEEREQAGERGERALPQRSRRRPLSGDRLAESSRSMRDGVPHAGRRQETQDR